MCAGNAVVPAYGYGTWQCWQARRSIGAFDESCGRISMICEAPHWNIPPHLKQLAKTQREQREYGMDAQFEEGWSKFYFDTAGTGGWAPFSTSTPRTMAR